MDPVLKAILLSWDWRWDVLFLLATAGGLYTTGWWRLRKQIQARADRNGKLKDQQKKLAQSSRWRPTLYLLGLFFIGLALMSPIDVLGAQLFFMHMIQHLLLIMIAPPLLLITNPLPFILWGLPRSLRKKVGRGISALISGSSPLRNRIKSATSPGVTWMLWVIAVIGWHDPSAYNAALRSSFVHDLEHLSFFTVGMLFWWHVIGAGPRIHKQLGGVGRIIFTLSVIPPNMIAGVAFAFAGQPIYAYSASYLGFSVLEDQKLGGVIMWVPGSMMYIVAALILAGQLLGEDQNRPNVPESPSGSEKVLALPSLEK